MRIMSGIMDGIGLLVITCTIAVSNGSGPLKVLQTQPTYAIML